MFSTFSLSLNMATKLSFERIKSMKQSMKDTVRGYLRGDLDEIPEIVECLILLFYFNQIDSEILSDAECHALLSLFSEQDKFADLGSYSYSLIYSSYNDGIGEKIFKEKCHGITNLLCILSAENGNVFGWYTAKGWEKRDDDDADDDNGGRKDDI